MQENKEKENNEKASWAQALEIFTEVSGWIAGPIIVSLVLGKYLDGRFGTKPWIFLGLTGLAFIISCAKIVRVVKKYIQKIEEENKNGDPDRRSRIHDESRDK